VLALPPKNASWPSALILLIAAVYFVLTAGRWIASPGLQYDELLFVNAATGEPTNGLFVAKRILGVPVMLMGYIGALKAYLYYPIFKLFGVSPETVRWPVIILSLVTLGIVYAVARFSFGRWVSALLVLVMSVDPAFMYLTKLDFGPVALMMALKLSALLFVLGTVTTGSSRYLWGASAACALGLFDKLNFIWFLLALAVAGGILFRGELGAAWRRDRRGFLLPLALLVVLTGVATVVLVIPQLAASQAETSWVTPLDRLRYVLGLYAGTMNGKKLYLLVTKSPLAAGSLTNAVVCFGLVGLMVAIIRAARKAGGVARLPLETRILGCHLLIFLLIVVQLLITKKAWGPHHIMMLYPFQFFIVFGAAVSLAGTVGATAAAAVLVVSGLSVGAAYERGFRPTAELEPQWSPVVYDLVDYVNDRSADGIVSVDWGIHNQVWALGTPRTRTTSRDRWPQFRTLGDRRAQELLYRRDFEDRRVLAILHGPGWDIMPTARKNFMEWADAFGMVPTLDRVFTSPAGTVIFEVYSVDGLWSASGPDLRSDTATQRVGP
jgi:4-amino-4-deoxy-L-arabinose transferase-like glycosyltransferase